MYVVFLHVNRYIHASPYNSLFLFYESDYFTLFASLFNCIVLHHLWPSPFSPSRKTFVLTGVNVLCVTRGKVYLYEYLFLSVFCFPNALISDTNMKFDAVSLKWYNKYFSCSSFSRDFQPVLSRDMNIYCPAYPTSYRGVVNCGAS